ncbi:ABC transporter permease [Aureimonas sp. AU4]|uniref:ABC transporter permease n=1 Tax=Aureimonas sp. AU4 TaxID=1638163 RepID=UPI00078398C1|nr:ABC transporter permease [Aureimonas sp. AU4]
MSPATLAATGDGDLDAPRAGGSRTALLAAAIRLAALGAFALIILYFAVFATGFLSTYNLVNIVEQSAILGILAYGMSVVIIGGGTDVTAGGIDLSIATTTGLCAALFAVMTAAGYPAAVAIAATLGAGMLVGLVNAFAIVGLGILPLLATLAVMNVAAGAELILTQNTVIPVDAPWLSAFSMGSFLGVSGLAWCLVIFTALIALLIHKTAFGLRLYAVGGHPEAARAAGIGVRGYVAFTYVFSGFCAGLASILVVSRLSASTPGTGDMLLSILAAALLGTVFSRRFVPSVGGTLLSVLFIGCLSNGFQLLNVSSYWVNGVQGALILLVVAVTSFARSPEA